MSTLNTASIPLSVRKPIQAIRNLAEGAPLAIVRALNRSIDSAHVAMGREVARDMKLKVGDARERIRVEHATLNRQTATLYASPKRLPLADFSATGPHGATASNPVPSRGRGRSVSANTGAGRKTYPGAFFARMRSGHVGVFVRAGADRKSRGAWSKNLPMIELRGASIVRSFRQHQHVGIARAEEQLTKNLRSELRYAASRRA